MGTLTSRADGRTKCTTDARARSSRSGDTLQTVALLAILATASAQEQCVFGAGEWVPYDAARACFESVPFSEEVRDETVDMLQKGMQLFSFLDISNDSPSVPTPKPIQVDLIAELGDMRSQQFLHDIDFHQAVLALFAEIQDTHTRYRPPQCYRDVDFYQPFNLVGYVSENGDHTIGVSDFIDAEVRQHFEDELGIPLSRYLGAEVIEINGINAVDFIAEYAETHVGVTKDRNTRFNIALARFAERSEGFRLQAGYWGFRNLERSPMPTEGSVSYLLQPEDGPLVQVSIPWEARSSRPFSDQCPTDVSKTEPEVCGCCSAETDTDGDNVPDFIVDNEFPRSFGQISTINA